jgi:hypothetical protein
MIRALPAEALPVAAKVRHPHLSPDHPTIAEDRMLADYREGLRADWNMQNPATGS